jgi:SAM-dependent methyltransferase
MRGDDGQGLTLDLGCGDGAHYPYLPDPENSFGVDLDQASLSKLKARYPDYPALRGDAYNLPLKDGCIDCIVNVYNLEHMLFLDHALEEMGRVLAPGGRIFVSLPAEGGLAWGLGRRLSTARRFGDENLDYLRALEIDHINCIWQLDKALRRHFRIRRLRLFPLGVPSFHLNLVVTYCCTAG